MLSFEITLGIKLDGQQLPGFPLVRKLTTTEGLTFDYTKASAAGFVTLPTGEIATLKVIFARADKAVALRLNGQSDAGIDLDADGFLLVVGGTIDAGALTNAMVENVAGSDARVDGFAAGN